jgi:hypothetical protein
MRKTNTIGKQKVYVQLENVTGVQQEFLRMQDIARQHKERFNGVVNPKTLGIIEGMKKVIDQLGLPINTA